MLHIPSCNNIKKNAHDLKISLNESENILYTTPQTTLDTHIKS